RHRGAGGGRAGAARPGASAVAMTPRRARIALALVAVALATAGGSAAQVMRGPVQELGQNAQGEPPEVEIIEHLGAHVSTGLAFTNSEGAAVRLSDFLGRGRPVLLTFTYHTCPMLCSLVLDGAAEALAAVDLRAGRD